MLSIRAAAHTDIGRVRRENEDCFLLDEKNLLFGVTDGVGGLPGGAEAAQLAVEEVSRSVRALPAGAEPNFVDLVQRTNETVVALGLKISPSMGIGTTLTFGSVQGTTMIVVHVGDSRCYMLREGVCTLLTEDHSVENEARMRRARGEVVFYHESNRNALTRCLGQPTPPDVDIVLQPLRAGDRFLFCTDGITRMMPDSEIGEVLGESDDPKVVIKEIVRIAVMRGGPDNATGVVVFIDSI